MENLSSSSKEIASELAVKLLRPLMELRMGMESKLSGGGDGGKSFILHRNQWSRLVEIFSSDLDFIKHKLEDVLQIFMASLRSLFSVMEAARKSFEECIAPHGGGYFRRDGSSGGVGGEYVWTEPELGDAEEAEEEQKRKRREDLRLWMAKHALRHILDRQIPHRHADNFRTASMAHIILYSPLLRHSSGTEEMTSELRDDTREARAFFSHEEMVKIDISQLLLHRLRDGENVLAAVERLFVDPAQFRKCDGDSGPRKLGEGGYGSVKLRKWMSDDHHVAVKKGELGRQEIEIQARVRHPNLLPLLCVCTGKRPGAAGKEQMFLPVMERMDSSLDRLIIPTSWTAFTLEVELMLQIAKGMEYLHSHNIVHRDLKPANILVSGYPDAEVLKIPELLRLRLAFLRVKVADFGVSKINFQTSDSFNTMKVGTGLYRAPEVLERSSRTMWRIGQSSRNDGYSRKADVYSFAMVCYRILSGKEPFEGDSRPQHLLLQKIRDEALRPKFDQSYPWPALVGMVEECWHQDASRRPDFVEIVKFIRFVKICALQHEFNFKSRPPQPVEVLYVAINRREELFREFRNMDFNLVHMLDKVAYRSPRG